MGVATFDDLLAAGTAKFAGDRAAFDQLRGLMVPFTPDFEILPGTATTKAAVPPSRPFVVPDLAPALSAGE